MYLKEKDYVHLDQPTLMTIQNIHPLSVRILNKEHMNLRKNENVSFLKNLILETSLVPAQELLKKIMKWLIILYHQILNLSRIYFF